MSSIPDEVRLYELFIFIIRNTPEPMKNGQK